MEVRLNPVVEGRGRQARVVRWLWRIEGTSKELHALVATIQVGIERGGNEAVLGGQQPIDIIVRNLDKRSVMD